MITLIASHFHPTSISFPSYFHLISILLPSHFHPTSISFPSYFHLAFILLPSRFHPTSISFPSYFHLISILLPSSHFHPTSIISFPSYSYFQCKMPRFHCRSMPWAVHFRYIVYGLATSRMYGLSTYTKI